MTRSRDEQKEDARRAMFTHLQMLNDTCEELLAARDPFGTANKLHTLRGLLAAIDSAARRYKTLA